MSKNQFIEKQYGLEKNPFLDRIAREQWLQTWVNREEQLRVWRRLISELESEKRNNVVFVIGDYGMGKTQSLFKIVDEANKSKHILSSFLNFRGEQRASNPGLDFMFRIIQSIDFDRLEKIKSKQEIINSINDISSDFDEVSVALSQCWSEDQHIRRLSRYFITGQTKPIKTELREIGVIRKIDNIDIAKEYFAGILYLLKTLGYKLLLLAVDEFEYLFSLVTRTQQSVYLALVRGLFDFPLGINMALDVEKMVNIALFLGISEDGFRRLQEIENEEAAVGGPTRPLLDRVTTTTLHALEKQPTRLLIEKRLHYNRKSGVFESEPLIPFDETFVNYVWELSGGSPRKIIWICSQVLDAGIEYRVPFLDRKTAERLLKEREEV